jgi:TRAP-type C4-dicarboxylate transport system permease small subunit
VSSGVPGERAERPPPGDVSRGGAAPVDGDPPSTEPSGWRLAPEEWACAATMALLCLITFANVLVRYLSNFSFAFTEEISVWLMVVMTLFGSAAAFTRRAHISITWFIEKLPPRGLALVRRWGLVASMLMFALLAVLGTRMAWDDYAYDVTTPAMGLPQWLYTVWLPVLSLLVLWRLLQAFFRAPAPDR